MQSVVISFMSRLYIVYVITENQRLMTCWSENNTISLSIKSISTVNCFSEWKLL